MLLLASPGPTQISRKQCEVVPVDTHVHQIAVKHYGLPRPGGSKGKATITPKLYQEIATRLEDIWGEYAGWAHSVRVYSSYKHINLIVHGDLVHS